MRLTKSETNELLKCVCEDNQLYGLIFKLIYIYGKEGMSVLSLQWEDIDFDNNTIWFKESEFPLSHYVKLDLLELYDISECNYVFLDVGVDVDNGIDVLRKRLRYYLHNRVKKLDVSHKIKHISLSITDLRRLRGQHLLLDGVGLDLIMDLYIQQDGTSTQFKRYLEYDDLMGRIFPCEDVDDLFGKYTDLDIFEFESSGDYKDSFVVGCDSAEFVIYFNGDGGLSFVGDVDESLREKVLYLFDCGVLDSLVLLGVNEYKVVGGFSFVKI